MYIIYMFVYVFSSFLNGIWIFPHVYKDPLTRHYFFKNKVHSYFFLICALLWFACSELSSIWNLLLLSESRWRDSCLDCIYRIVSALTTDVKCFLLSVKFLGVLGDLNPFG